MPSGLQSLVKSALSMMVSRLKIVISAQTRQVFANLKAVLEAAGSSLDKIVKTTCFMDNMNDFAKMNEVYASFFSGDYPSRSAVEVAKLPKGALIEIEVIAYL